MEQHSEGHEDTVRRLAMLDDLPVEDHVAVYEELHRQLHDQLSDDAATGDDAAHPSRH